MWVYFSLFTSLHYINSPPPNCMPKLFISPNAIVRIYLLIDSTYLQIDKKNNYVFGEIPALLQHFCAISLCESEEFTT